MSQHCFVQRVCGHFIRHQDAQELNICQPKKWRNGIVPFAKKSKTMKKKLKKSEYIYESHFKKITLKNRWEKYRLYSIAETLIHFHGSFQANWCGLFEPIVEIRIWSTAERWMGKLEISCLNLAFSDYYFWYFDGSCCQRFRILTIQRRKWWLQ